MAQVKPIPEGYRTITPHLLMDDSAKAIEFWTRALGAQEVRRQSLPNGKVVHAVVRIGDSLIMVNDDMGPMGNMPGTVKSAKAAGLNTSELFLYVEDCDALFNRAVKAGCTVRMALADQFWGDRFGQVIDPFGIIWGIATHKEDVAPQEIMQRMAKAMPSQPQA